MERLPGDRGTEGAVREVLEFFRIHVREWLSPADVARRLERPESFVSVILSNLAAGYVLTTDGDRFRYDPDPVIDLDVQRFLRRAATHTQLVQNNLAKFRDRYGSR